MKNDQLSDRIFLVVRGACLVSRFVGRSCVLASPDMSVASLKGWVHRSGRVAAAVAFNSPSTLRPAEIPVQGQAYQFALVRPVKAIRPD